MYSRSATNSLNVCENCKTVDGASTLVDNIEKAMNNVNAVKGSYVLKNTKKTYEFTFDIITKDKKINWDVAARGSFDSKEVSFYLKDKKFYIVYPNNGANIILKDDLTKMVKEIDETLDIMDASYNKKELESIITGSKLSGIDFETIKEHASYQVNSDKTYTVTHTSGTTKFEYIITSNFLIKSMIVTADNFTSTLNLEYPENVKIEYPNGLDFLTLNIEDTKKLLEVDNFAQVIDPDLKK